MALRYMKYSFIMALMLLTFLQSVAQMGNPPITGFEPKVYNGSSDIGLLYQSKRGLWYMAGSGQYILEYDGVSWNKIPVYCSTPDAIIEDKNGNLFVSDLHTISITLLKPDSKTGDWVAENVDIDIIDSVENKNIYISFREIDGEIYATPYSSSNHVEIPLVYKYDGERFKALKIYAPKNLTNNHLLNNKGIAICQDNAFLYDIKTLKKEALNIDKSVLENIYMIDKYSPDDFFVVTYNNGIWKYNLLNHSLTRFGTKKANQLLKGVSLLNIKQLNNGNFVVNTIGSGLFIFDHEGRFIRNITTNEGLNSNITVRTYQDNQNQLWVGLFSGGVHRLDINAPVDIWTEKNGVEGGAVSYILKFQGDYIAKTVTHLVYFDKSTNSWKPINQNIQEDYLLLKKLKLADGKEHLFMGAYSALFEVTKAKKTDKWKQDIIKFNKAYDYTIGIANQPKQPNKIYMWSDTEVYYFYYNKDRKKKIELKQIKSLAGKNIDSENIQVFGNSLWTVELGTLKPIELDMTTDKVYTYPLKTNQLAYIGGKVQIVNPNQDSVFTITKNRQIIYNNELSQMLANYSDINVMIRPVGKNNLCITQKDQHFFCNFLRKDKNGDYKRDFLIEQILNKYQIARIVTDPDNENIVWVATSEGILKLDLSKSLKKENQRNNDFVCYIRQVALNSDSIVFNGNFTTLSKTSTNEQKEYEIIPQQLPEQALKIEYKDNNIKFKVAAPYFIEEQQTKYVFMLEGYDNKWVKTDNPEKEYAHLSVGKYTLRAKAINYLKQESKEAIYRFEILSPWYQTWWAYTLYAFSFLGLGFSIFALYTRNLRKKNEYLEKMVERRTKQISHANMILQERNDEIIMQRDLLDERNKEIDAQNKNIWASINYAANIQTAILPFEERISKFISNYFILYKPRDIISGDFYWIEKVGNKIIIAISDCTGHGVPGAFMSILGSNGITDTVFQQRIIEPHLMLENLHKYIYTALKQESSQNNDGMEIAIVVWDTEENVLEFSGARRPLYIVQNNEITRIRGNGMGLGGVDPRNQRKYTKKTIKIEGNTSIYMASDGFQDQIGGKERRKFMGSRFQELLFEVSTLPVKLQKELLDKRLEEWKDGEMQIDDILVFGMQINN